MGYFRVAGVRRAGCSVLRNARLAQPRVKVSLGLLQIGRIIGKAHGLEIGDRQTGLLVEQDGFLGFRLGGLPLLGIGSNEV